VGFIFDVVDRITSTRVMTIGFRQDKSPRAIRVDSCEAETAPLKPPAIQCPTGGGPDLIAPCHQGIQGQSGECCCPLVGELGTPFSAGRINDDPDKLNAHPSGVIEAIPQNSEGSTRLRIP
jgi:hypothetical protein